MEEVAGKVNVAGKMNAKALDKAIEALKAAQMATETIDGIEYYVFRRTPKGKFRLVDLEAK